MTSPRWRWLLLLLLVPLIAGVMRLRFDAEILDLMPANIPAVEGLKRYQKHFANAQDLILTVEAPDAESATRAAELLATSLRGNTYQVSEVTWQPPWIEHPEQAPELIAFLWLNQPPETFQQFADKLTPDKLSDVLDATREQLATTLSPMDIAQLSYDPFGFTRLPESVAGMAPGFAQSQQLFSSTDGTFRILFVRPAGVLSDYKQCIAWMTDIQRDAASTLKTSGINGVKLGYTGRPAFVSEISQSMRREMILSSVGTALTIALLFWFAHRRWRPMLWLLTLLAIVLAATMAIGGLIFGTIHVISMGFAAILLGLAVDYAVVHYQEALAHPQMTVPQIRRAIAPAIFWAATTTIAAFVVLNFGGLPGLAQLGSLVAIGVALSAFVMIFAYLPPLFPERMRSLGVPAPLPAAPSDSPARVPALPGMKDFVIPATAAILVLCFAILLWRGLPGVDAGTAALQPKNSPAYAALDMMKTRLGQTQEPLFVVIAGRSESEVADQLDRIEPTLAAAVSNQTLASYTLPVALWAHPANQQSNSIAARKLIGQRDTLRNAALAGGFSQDALGLSDTVLDTWQRAATGPQPFWPTNAFCTWILDKLTARDEKEFHAVGILFPTTNATPEMFATLESEIGDQRSEVRNPNTQHATRNTPPQTPDPKPHPQIWLSGWGLLGDAVLSVVKSNLWKLVVPMVSLVLLSLGFAFRRPAEILLSLGSLLLSGLILLSVMSLANWSWNVLNLMALPLILGTGVDYGIFMQLALRRYGGDLELTRRAVGRALLLCGATAIAGFGALGFSSNAGMASLGRVCAVGIAGNMLIAVYLLPTWWKLVGQASCLSSGGINREPCHPLEGDAHRTGKMPVPLPSSLYRARLWTLGVKLCGVLPQGFCNFVARTLALIYCRIASHRRHVVEENLLPLLNGDHAAARRTAPKLFAAFATKLVDLLRYEGGAPIGQRITSWNGWEHFQSAAAQNRGVLLITPHLGNWEFGGPFLTERGHKLLVLTQAEPDPELTRIRQESRARWGIETLVVGEDPFSFIEIIKRLQAGATVALLIDRPPEVSGVTVEFCGKPFQASIAAAELARASGCALVPVFLVLQGATYTAQILPEITYERAALGNRAARTALTQEIMRALEPAIRQHPGQWFHFVPVWKEDGK